MRTISAVELDPHAAKVYSANMPGVPVQCCKVGDATLPYADIVIGGPPCQDFSSAGKGAGVGGDRNGWPEAIDAIRRVRPRMFLFENVPGMASGKHVAYLKSVVADLGRLGYSVLVTEQDAANHGTPQFRRRLWFWGIRKDVGAIAKWPVSSTWWPKNGRRRGSLEQPPWGEYRKTPTVRDALGLDGDIQPPRQTGARTRVPTTEPSVALTGTRCDELRIHEYRWSDAMLEKHPPAVGDEPSPTVQAKWFKGGAEGLLRVDEPAPCLKAGGNVDAFGHMGGSAPPRIRVDGSKPNSISGTRVLSPDEPSPVVGACSQELIELGSKQPRTFRPIDDPSTTVAHDDRRHLRAGGIFVRRLTPEECLRLQGGPADFDFAGVVKTHRYRIVGNGWACPHAAAMGRALAEADPTSETVIDLFAGGGLGSVGFHQRFSTTVTE